MRVSWLNWVNVSGQSRAVCRRPAMLSLLLFPKKKKKWPKPTNQKPTRIPPTPNKQTGWILGFGSFLLPSFLSSHRGLRLCIPRLCLSCVTSLVSNRLIVIKKMIWIMKGDLVMPRGFHSCILLPLIIVYYLNCRDGQSCGSYMKEYNVFFCLPWIFFGLFSSKSLCLPGIGKYIFVSIYCLLFH